MLPPFDKNYRLTVWWRQRVVILLSCLMGKKVKLPPADPKDFRGFFIKMLRIFDHHLLGIHEIVYNNIFCKSVKISSFKIGRETKKSV